MIYIYVFLAECGSACFLCWHLGFCEFQASQSYRVQTRSMQERKQERQGRERGKEGEGGQKVSCVLSFIKISIHVWVTFSKRAIMFSLLQA